MNRGNDNELKRLGEFGFIDALTRVLKLGPAVELGPGDDCAIVRVDAGRLLLSADASVEDIHFRRSWGARNIGWRAMASALSDIAAMGGEPLVVLASVALPTDLPDGFATDLCAGLAEAAETVDASLVGGDVVRSPRGVFIDVHVTGVPTSGRVLTRDAARPGDLIALSGWPGVAAAGVIALERNIPLPEPVHTATLRPVPRIQLGQTLAAIDGIHGAIDISDGLLQDLGHIARRSGVRMLLESRLLPVSPELESLCGSLGLRALDYVLTGGEAYELAITLAPDAWEAALCAAGRCGIPLHRIGTVVEGTPDVLVDGEQPSVSPGFNHFG